MRGKSMARLYDTDMAAWSEKTAQLLIEGRHDELDLDALIEEILGLGKAERDAIESHLYQLLYHLLKLAYGNALDVERAGRGWRLSVNEARRGMRRRLQKSPSLAGYPLEVLDAEYEDARRQAAQALLIPIENLPEPCPWAIEQVLDAEFWPYNETNVAKP
jgi:hypothetical protein